MKRRTDLYATDSDFCQIFREDMSSLYLLSLVLTADREKAEQCFVSGLDDCAASNQVFKDWARSWARRVVIKNAIRVIAPGLTQVDSAPSERNGDHAGLLAELTQPELPAELSALLELPALERFAFVMSFCEGYADRDCALLLGCSRDNLVAARANAIDRIKNSAAAREGILAKGGFRSEVDAHNGIHDLTVSAHLATSA